MTDIDVAPHRVGRMAEMHEDGARAVTSLAASTPAQPDGGMASDVLAAILGRLVQDADALAMAEEQVAEVLRGVQRNYLTTEDEVREGFDRLSGALEE